MEDAMVKEETFFIKQILIIISLHMRHVVYTYHDIQNICYYVRSSNGFPSKRIDVKVNNFMNLKTTYSETLQSKQGDAAQLSMRKSNFRSDYTTSCPLATSSAI